MRMVCRLQVRLLSRLVINEALRQLADTWHRSIGRRPATEASRHRRFSEIASDGQSVGWSVGQSVRQSVVGRTYDVVDEYKGPAASDCQYGVRCREIYPRWESSLGKH
jgi:protein tyrosine phosphatase (PTP) superfamily phosphohydrolase (DUF442 family)